MKGCVNDVSECRNNCRRNSLKEMRWNRIERTSSRMTGKDEFRDFCLREWIYIYILCVCILKKQYNFYFFVSTFISKETFV